MVALRKGLAGVRLAFAAVGLAFVAGCVSEPQAPLEAGLVTARPKIVSLRRPLTRAEVAGVVQRLAPSPDGDQLLRRHLAVEQAIAETPLIEGEDTQLLRDGPATLSAMFAAIAAAKHEVDLDYYIFDDVRSDGVSLGDLLVAKRSEGIVVNAIYDSYGSSATPRAFFDRLREAGVNLLEFDPMNPLKARGFYAPNWRDHRKLLVVDGEVAMVGGVNMDHVYETATDKEITGTPGPRWRDTDLEIKGPAVLELRSLFETHWRGQHGPPLEQAPARAAAAGAAVVRVIGSSPSRAEPRYYVTLISAIRSAERRITLTTAYFVPTRDEIAALTEAAQRGVEVRLMLPDHSDSALALAVGRSHYGELLKAGVKIYELHGLTLHTKIATVDGVWSVIGSSNLDHRSVVFNDELDVVALGARTASEVDALFDDDCKIASPVDLQSWSHRSFRARFLGAYGKIWEALL